MAAMDQGKLNSMCASINSAAGDYEARVTNAVNTLQQTFNNNWISNSSKSLANEIATCVDELVRNVKQVFTNRDDAIRASVNNFNSVENESISYPGFTFGTPSTGALNSLNNTLPNGKVGVAEGADLNTINNDFTTFVSQVDDTLNNIVTTVQNADAFDSSEQQALTSSVTTIKNNFNSSMDTLKSQLNTRVSSEISTRDQLNQTNISNLQG